jgi:hypothetical protein
MDSGINRRNPRPDHPFIGSNHRVDIPDQRQILETTYKLAPRERNVDTVITSPKTPSQNGTQESAAQEKPRKNIAARELARAADLQFQPYNNLYSKDYYPDLEASIDELHMLEEKHQAYITQNNSQEKPVSSYLHLIEKIQAPMPFQIFAESHPKSQVTTSGDAYLKLEIGIPVFRSEVKFLII